MTPAARQAGTLCNQVNCTGHIPRGPRYHREATPSWWVELSWIRVIVPFPPDLRAVSQKLRHSLVAKTICYSGVFLNSNVCTQISGYRYYSQKHKLSGINVAILFPVRKIHFNLSSYLSFEHYRLYTRITHKIFDIHKWLLSIRCIPRSSCKTPWPDVRKCVWIYQDI